MATAYSFHFVNKEDVRLPPKTIDLFLDSSFFETSFDVLRYFIFKTDDKAREMRMRAINPNH